VSTDRYERAKATAFTKWRGYPIWLRALWSTIIIIVVIVGAVFGIISACSVKAETPSLVFLINFKM
jgi:hypothetical protein